MVAFPLRTGPDLLLAELATMREMAFRDPEMGAMESLRTRRQNARAIRGALFLVGWIVPLAITACAVRPVPALDARSYVAWVEDPSHGLRVARDAGGYRIEALYTPPEYVVLRERRLAPPTAAQLAARKTELGNLQYVTLRIGARSGQDVLVAGAGSNEEYFARLDYALAAMQSDLHLRDGDGNTSACVLYHFERTYGIAPHATFVLGFEPGRTGSDADRTLVLDDRVLGFGRVELPIRGRDLRRVPRLAVASS